MQQALNDCQTDICDQLQEFKTGVKADIHQAESDLYKALERKANLLDVQEADYKEVAERSVPKSDFSDLLYKVDKLAKEVQGKLDARGNFCDKYDGP